jgi:hypothetical protein
MATSTHPREIRHSAGACCVSPTSVHFSVRRIVLLDQAEAHQAKQLGLTQQNDMPAAEERPVTARWIPLLDALDLATSTLSSSHPQPPMARAISDPWHTVSTEPQDAGGYYRLGLPHNAVYEHVVCGPVHVGRVLP